MGALRGAAAALALGWSLLAGPSLAQEAAPWRLYVHEAAARFAIPEAWVLRVIAAESGGRTHLRGRPITSSAGAMGLMQIMPATWAELRGRLGLGSDPHDPRDNILAGTAYLRAMYERFGYPGLFAAYNAGPGRYRDYLERGRPLPRETRRYVARIMGTASSRRSARGARASAPAPYEAPVIRNGAVAPPTSVAVDPIFLMRARDADAPAANGREMPMQGGVAMPRTFDRPGRDRVFL